ncbi:ShlB/FhaC/HecB family hemolysin secretion/activation protein [Marinobacter sp. F3R08]|uniref:ShlB/FhaC/HecB family hemolysin secretion/activation protein n=1 Tax=Marinobacter sp. F3R08 TaxID=2841559 RepID=UPI001C09E9A0|nr:ShlB/FhaC/HecB family hemolysin secretion/activation protein [Marinobacter sp. F3R08]MBU2953769.1 hypothetical protein [Marinobacter sp. F3R08]
MRYYVFICILLLHTVLPSNGFAATHSAAVIGAVAFEGVTVFNAQQIAGVYQPIIGQRFQSDTRSRLADRSRELYIENGFLTPDVKITEHPEIAGVILVQVTEPGISLIKLTNANARETSRIQRLLAPLKRRRPIAKALIERTLASLSDRTDLNFDYELISLPDRPADLQLVLTVLPDINGSLTYTSEGDRRLDRHLVLGHVSVLKPVSHVNEFSVSALHSLESDSYRVGSGNLEFGVNARNSVAVSAKTGRAILDRDTAPDTVYRFQEMQSRWTYDLAPASPYSTEVYGSVITRSFTRTADGVRELNEHLRMAETGLHRFLAGTDRLHRVALSARFGFDTWGARRDGTQAGSTIDTEFQIIRPEYTLWQGLPAGFMVRADIEGQYSPDNLPSSQRFTIGGSSFSRAYEPAEFSGDSGLGGHIELRRKLADSHWLPAQVTPFIYYALAAIRNNDSNEKDSAAAAGIGLRVSSNDYSGFLEYGKPLTVSSRYKDDEARLNGRITVHF